MLIHCPGPALRSAGSDQALTCANGSQGNLMSQYRGMRRISPGSNLALFLPYAPVDVLVLAVGGRTFMQPHE